MVLSRLRFDHTGLNKTLYLLGKVHFQVCTFCNTIFNNSYDMFNTFWCGMWRYAPFFFLKLVLQSAKKYKVEEEEVKFPVTTLLLF